MGEGIGEQEMEELVPEHFRTTWVSWHLKCRTILDCNEAEMTGWQWLQLDHMQIIYTSLQTYKHARTSSLTENCC